jgi:carbon monoxide dehydrogenase subunit G
MDLTHRFSVPAQIDEAWNAFNNLEELAPCFPGATIESIEGDEFTGSVKIKLGPVALVYNGSGRYVERNDTDRRVVIEARGKDKRGNGTATAIVTASFAESGEQTDVEVLTDLAITGKPAQFGRGVISDVSDKLLDQFVACVSGRFTEGLGATEEASPSAASASDTATRFDEADTEQTIELETVPGAAGSEDAGSSPGPEVAPPVTPAAPAPAAPPATGAPRYTTPPSDTGQGELNLFSTVVPVVLKRYGPALAIVGLLLFIVIKIIRRKS